jgi:hypothetical protein
VQSLGLLFSTLIASRGDLLRPPTAVLPTISDIHRMFADFQSQRRKRKIEVVLEPSSLISASRTSIFTQNTGVCAVRRRLNEC